MRGGKGEQATFLGVVLGGDSAGSPLICLCTASILCFCSYRFRQHWSPSRSRNKTMPYSLTA